MKKFLLGGIVLSVLFVLSGNAVFAEETQITEDLEAGSANKEQITLLQTILLNDVAVQNYLDSIDAASGVAVRANIQAFLGTFGPKTTSALLEFQRGHLTEIKRTGQQCAWLTGQSVATGIAGPCTRGYLNELLRHILDLRYRVEKVPRITLAARVSSGPAPLSTVFSARFAHLSCGQPLVLETSVGGNESPIYGRTDAGQCDDEGMAEAWQTTYTYRNPGTYQVKLVHGTGADTLESNTITVTVTPNPADVYDRLDINRDKSIDVADVQTLVNVSLGSASCPALSVCDLSRNGTVGQEDVDQVVDAVLGTSTQLATAYPHFNYNGDAYVNGDDVGVLVDIILGRTSVCPVSKNCDVNASGSSVPTVSDVQFLINIITSSRNGGIARAQVQYPNGSEDLIWGERAVIRYTLANKNVEISAVNVNTGTVTRLTGVTPSATVYDWSRAGFYTDGSGREQMLMQGNYRIRVCEADALFRGITTNCDESDQPFILRAANGLGVALSLRGQLASTATIEVPAGEEVSLPLLAVVRGGVGNGQYVLSSAQTGTGLTVSLPNPVLTTGSQEKEITATLRLASNIAPGTTFPVTISLYPNGFQGQSNVAHGSVTLSVKAAISPVPVVLSPNGGERYTLGQNTALRIKRPQARVYAIELVALDRTTYPLFNVSDANTPAGDFSLTWRAGYYGDSRDQVVAPGQYKIRSCVTVLATGGLKTDACDESNAAFTLVAASAAMKAWQPAPSGWGPAYCNEGNRYAGPRICSAPTGQVLTGESCSAYATGLVVKTAYNIASNYKCTDSSQGESSTFTLRLDAATQPTTVIAGAIDAQLATFVAENNVNDGTAISALGLTLGGTLAPSDLTSCTARMGNGTRLNTGSNLLNPASRQVTLRFDSPMTVRRTPNGGIFLRCNIAASAQGTVAWTLTGVTSSGPSTAAGALPLTAPTVTVVPSGSFAVALGSDSPARRDVAAGTSNVLALLLNFRAGDEPVSVEKIGLVLTAGNPSDVLSGKIYDGATQIGNLVFTGGSRFATSTLSGTLLVPANTSKLISVKIDLAEASVIGQAHLVAIDWSGNPEGTTGIGVNSGMTIRATGQPTASAGINVTVEAQQAGAKTWQPSANGWGPAYCNESNRYGGPRICTSPSRQILTGLDCSAYATGLIVKTAFETGYNFRCMESTGAVQPATISLTAPQDSTEFNLSQPLTVAWAGSQITAVTMQYKKQNTDATWPTAWSDGPTNQTAASFAAGSGLGTEGWYKIRVCAAAGTPCSGEVTVRRFNSAATVTLTSPAANQSFTLGTPIVARYTGSNVVATSGYRLDYRRDGVYAWTTAQTAISGDLTLATTGAAFAVGKYYVQVCALNDQNLVYPICSSSVAVLLADAPTYGFSVAADSVIKSGALITAARGSSITRKIKIVLSGNTAPTVGISNTGILSTASGNPSDGVMNYITWSPTTVTPTTAGVEAMLTIDGSRLYAGDYTITTVLHPSQGSDQVLTFTLRLTDAPNPVLTKTWQPAPAAWGPAYCDNNRAEPKRGAGNTMYDGPKISACYTQGLRSQNLTGQDCAAYATGLVVKTGLVQGSNYRCTEATQSSLNASPNLATLLEALQQLLQSMATNQ